MQALGQRDRGSGRLYRARLVEVKGGSGLVDPKASDESLTGIEALVFESVRTGFASQSSPTDSKVDSKEPGSD